MKDLFEDLNKAVPTSGGTKASKWEILSKGMFSSTPLGFQVLTASQQSSTFSSSQTRISTTKKRLCAFRAKPNMPARHTRRTKC